MSAKHRKGLTMKAVAVFMLLGFLFPAVNTILAQELRQRCSAQELHGI